MFEASCHCGAVKFEVAALPAQLTSCNCSLCRRLGTLMAYYRPAEVRFTSGLGQTVPYIQGDKTLAMHHCPTCGCPTHWESLDPALDRMGVNARLFAPDAIKPIRIRTFDGADTWTYLD